MSKKSTKEKILEATLSLISEKGYLGATTRDIAMRAGISEITLFRHFGSKENLFEGVLNRYTFLPRIKEMRPTLDTLPYPEALYLVGIELLRTLKEGKPLASILVCECKLYPEKVTRVFDGIVDDIITTLAGYLEEKQKEGEIRKFLPVDMARLFLRQVYSYFLIEEIIRGGNLGKGEMEKNVKLIVDIFVHGIHSFEGDR